MNQQGMRADTQEDPSQIDTDIEPWTSSQQSGRWKDSPKAGGAQEGVQVITLHLQRMEACFSEEEKEYFLAAALGGRVSQAHYANPDAEMCYRRPSLSTILNPDGLGRHTARHFLRMRNSLNREFLVALREDPQKQIGIKTGGITARRSGADPSFAHTRIWARSGYEAKSKTDNVSASVNRNRKGNQFGENGVFLRPERIMGKKDPVRAEKRKKTSETN